MQRARDERRARLGGGGTGEGAANLRSKKIWRGGRQGQEMGGTKTEKKCVNSSKLEGNPNNSSSCLTRTKFAYGIRAERRKGYHMKIRGFPGGGGILPRRGKGALNVRRKGGLNIYTGKGAYTGGFFCISNSPKKKGRTCVVIFNREM